MLSFLYIALVHIFPHKVVDERFYNFLYFDSLHALSEVIKSFQYVFDNSIRHSCDEITETIDHYRGA